MSAEEAREKFRFAAGPERGLAPELTLDEAKQAFRGAASELDNALGLNTEKSGVWSAALFCITMLFGMGRTQSWLVPLISGLGNFGGKAFDMLAGMFSKKTDEKKPRRATRTPKQ